METEEKLCIKVLRTLQQMLVKRNKYGERVRTVVPWPRGTSSAPLLVTRVLSHLLLWCWPCCWDTQDVHLSWQGNLLRKMLLNNYLQNKKSSSKGEIMDAAGGGECSSPVHSLSLCAAHTHLESPAPEPGWDQVCSWLPCLPLRGSKR